MFLLPCAWMLPCDAEMVFLWRGVSHNEAT